MRGNQARAPATCGAWVFYPPGRPSAGETAHPQMQMVTNAGEMSIAAALAGHGPARALSYQVAAKVRTFVDFALERLRSEPVLNGRLEWPAPP